MLFAAALLLATTLPIHAAEKFDSAAAARTVAPFVERETIAVGRIDLSRVSLAPLAALITNVAPDATDDVARLEKAADAKIDALRRAGVKEAYLILTLGGRSMIPQVVTVLPDASKLDQPSIRAALALPSPDYGRQVGDAFVCTWPAFNMPAEFHPVERPELADALAAVGDRPLTLAIIPPDSTRRVIEELVPTLPEPIGGGSSTIVTHGIRWAALSLELSPELSVRLTTKAEDAAAADALRTKWLAAVKFAAQDKHVRQALPHFDQVAALVEPRQAGDRLTVAFDAKGLMESGALAPLRAAIGDSLSAADRRQSTQNLQQLGLAMHNYYGQFEHFPPPASRGPGGTPLLSWRVALLPYVDQAELYKQFHLDEPWNGPHNRPLIEKMPAIFRSPRSRAPAGRTNYLVPVGGGALYASLADKPQFKDITDGTSHTIIIVEADDRQAAIWTKPDDLAFDPRQPMRGLGSLYPQGFGATFCDGSFRFIHKTIDAATLKALFTRDGGEAIDWSKL